MQLAVTVYARLKSAGTAFAALLLVGIVERGLEYTWGAVAHGVEVLMKGEVLVRPPHTSSGRPALAYSAPKRLVPVTQGLAIQLSPPMPVQYLPVPVRPVVVARAPVRPIPHPVKPQPHTAFQKPQQPSKKPKQGQLQLVASRPPQPYWKSPHVKWARHATAHVPVLGKRKAPPFYYEFVRDDQRQEWERTGKNNQHYGASEWMHATWKGHGDLLAQVGWKPLASDSQMA
jgi:hypothetical protein